MRKARRRHTLQTSALVHEADLRLGQNQQPRFRNRVQFLAIYALPMRPILAGHERTRRAGKRGVDGKLRLGVMQHVTECRPFDLHALDDALTGLARFDLQQSSRRASFLERMAIEETAAASLYPKTVERLWPTTRIWPLHEMSLEKA